MSETKNKPLQVQEYEELIARELKMVAPFSTFSGFFVCWKDVGENRRFALTTSMPGAFDLYGRIVKTSPVEIWRVRDGYITRKVAG